MTGPLTVLPHEHSIAFESFGVRIKVNANDSRVVQWLHSLPPAGARPCEVETVEHEFTVNTNDGLRFTIHYDLHGEAAKGNVDDDIWVGGDPDLKLALAFLDAHVRECIALNAPQHLFLRGGAVLHGDRVIAVLGEALTGTTTLVDALVSAGATHYSDEYAVFDDQGRIHRFVRPSSGPSEAGATNGAGRVASAADGEPRDVAAFVVTGYTPGAEWRPQALSRGESMLALLGHTVIGEDRPKDAMKGVARILDREPTVIRSERGEADAVARSLLEDAQLQRSGAA